MVRLGLLEAGNGASHGLIGHRIACIQIKTWQLSAGRAKWLELTSRGEGQ